MWLVVLSVGLAIASCGQQQATDSHVAAHSTNVTPTAMTDESTENGSGPTTLTVDAECPVQGYPYVKLITGFKSWSTVVGTIDDPTEPQRSTLVEESDDAPAMVYGEFTVSIRNILSGPSLDKQLSISFQGGKSDRYVTQISAEAQSAWAPDGSFLGLVRPDAEAPSGWIADMLPIVNDRVVFPDIGCFEPAGLQDVSQQSLAVLIFDNGIVREVSGSYPTAALSEIIDDINS